MTFVHVENLRIDPERVQCFDAADAEHDFLTHPHFLIAAVKLRGDQAIFGVVFRSIGVEKKQIDSADRQLPNLGKDFPVQNAD